MQSHFAVGMLKGLYLHLFKQTLFLYCSFNAQIFSHYPGTFALYPPALLITKKKQGLASLALFNLKNLKSTTATEQQKESGSSNCFSR